MTIARIASHKADALSRLLEQSKGRPVMGAVIGNLAQTAQAFEDMAFSFIDARYLANAQGAQLDAIGTLVGQARNGQTDAIYRIFLAGRIYANNSNTTTPTITQLIQTVFGAKTVQVISELSPGFAHRRAPGVVGFEIGSPAIPRSLWQQAIAVCKDSLAAAVRISWVTIFDADNSFALDGPVAGVGLDGGSVAMGMAEIIYQDRGQ